MIWNRILNMQVWKYSSLQISLLNTQSLIMALRWKQFMEPGYFYPGRSSFNLRENCWAACVHTSCMCVFICSSSWLMQPGSRILPSAEACEDILWGRGKPAGKKTCFRCSHSFCLSSAQGFVSIVMLKDTLPVTSLVSLWTLMNFLNITACCSREFCSLCQVLDHFLWFSSSAPHSTCIEASQFLHWSRQKNDLPVLAAVP